MISAARSIRSSCPCAATTQPPWGRERGLEEDVHASFFILLMFARSIAASKVAGYPDLHQKSIFSKYKVARKNITGS